LVIETLTGRHGRDPPRSLAATALPMGTTAMVEVTTETFTFENGGAAQLARTRPPRAAETHSSPDRAPPVVTSDMTALLVDRR
jgi:hypothetical protein